MTSAARTPVLLLLALGAVLALSSCASGTGSPGGSAAAPLGSVLPALPSGAVIAQGTVLDVGGSPELCLGAVAESYPPQCDGIPLTDWSWSGIEGVETAEDVTWGAYAVQGEYDGEAFTVTQPPIMLALYDPMPIPDPTGGEPGVGTEDELLGIQEQLPDRLDDAYLSSYADNGRLWVDVVWDDGTWQDAADAEHGEDMVVIRSAMRAVEG